MSFFNGHVEIGVSDGVLAESQLNPVIAGVAVVLCRGGRIYFSGDLLSRCIQFERETGRSGLQ